MVAPSLKELLISCGAIQFGDFTLASGKKSRVYINIKQAMTDPVILDTIARQTVRMALSWDRIAGVAVGGIPLAVAVSLAATKPYSIIRKEQKDHGIADLIIGDVGGREVLLIEDVTTSGGSAIFGIDQIRAAGGSISTVISVVDRDEGATDLLREHGVRLIPLVSMHDLVS